MPVGASARVHLVTAGTPPDSPFTGTGQWIWYVSRSGSDAAAIASKAKAHGITTVFVKSGDGGTYWPQFDQIVGPLKAQGIKVCAWQFVYARRPRRQAKIAIRAIRSGADCFVVDAESSFEGGHYAAARAYMKKIRLVVGLSYPIGLSSFPYVDYHPSFPYSAFFEPPYGAQFNLPQVYWRAIGTPVTTAMDHTYLWNNIYATPIAPTAGTWLGESKTELKDFRQDAVLNGSPGVSYWNWQETRPWQWSAFSAPLDPSLSQNVLPVKYPKLAVGSKGDAVVWAQTQLNEWGYLVRSSGYFRQATADAVRGFQTDHNLPITGELDATTWAELLKPPTQASAHRPHGGGGVVGNKASVTARALRSEPASSRLPALDYEVPQLRSK